MANRKKDFTKYAFGQFNKPFRWYCEELKNQRELGELFITVTKDAFDNVKYDYANPGNITISGSKKSGKTEAKMREWFYMITKIASAFGYDFAEKLLDMIKEIKKYEN